MARTPLYSPSPQRPVKVAIAPAPVGPGSAAQDGTTLALEAAPQGTLQRLQGAARRHERWLWAGGALLLALWAGWPAWTAKIQRPLTVEQIDAAMRESIAKEPLPSAAAAAYEAILPSVVRVVGIPVGIPVGLPVAAPADAASAAPGKGAAPLAKAEKPKSTKPKSGEADDDDEDSSHAGRSVGTGVVIVDKGLILTNLHVVAGAGRIMVTFFDGSESEAVVVSLQPKDDLAVLQAKIIPDDLHAATLRSTQGLAPGDQVLAVGFPFGIGPSASAGIVSGLKREFRSPEGKRQLSNLIQFDAAANPGNSGGPLVTMDGHVVGIVTAIMNPNRQRTFIGIGFAVPIENAAAAVGMPPF